VKNQHTHIKTTKNKKMYPQILEMGKMRHGVANGREPNKCMENHGGGFITVGHGKLSTAVNAIITPQKRSMCDELQ